MLQRLKFCLVNILHDMNDSKLSRINLFIAQLDIKRVGGDKIGTIDLNFSEVLISEKLLLNFKGEERSQNSVLNCIVCFPVNSNLVMFSKKGFNLKKCPYIDCSGPPSTEKGMDILFFYLFHY